MKSLLISLALMGFVFYGFMTLIDSNSRSEVSQIPGWTIYPILYSIGAGYLLALYLGVVGITQQQRLANGAGILVSLVGLGLIGAGVLMVSRQGEAAEGQFDYEWNAKNSADLALIQPILDQAHLDKSNIKLLTFWDLTQSDAPIAACVQKGHIIGFRVQNMPLTDVSCFSKLPQLAALSLIKCNLNQPPNLNLPRAERLTLNHNNLTDLSGIVAPNVKWLSVENNQLRTLSGVENLPQAQYVSFAKNPRLIDYSAAQNHPQLSALAAK
jgi:hypothetical protein